VATAFYCVSKRQPSVGSWLTSNEAIPTIDAQLAYDCLTSVPLNAAAATDLVTSILPYLQWQSGELVPITRSCGLIENRPFISQEPTGRLHGACNRHIC
jgi:hypothetical protein